MKDTKNEIKPVKDNYEKSLSYRENMSRYNKAKKAGFYFECLWILYAMLEDRTSSFFYHLGFTSKAKRNRVTGTEKIKKEIRAILGMRVEDTKYRFDTMSGKLERIRTLKEWSLREDEAATAYQAAVRDAVQQACAVEGFENCLSYLDNEWRDKRNQLTHALFNKSAFYAGEELLPLVEEGYRAARTMDKAVSQLKKKNLRKRFRVA